MSYSAPNPLPYKSHAWSNIAAAGCQRVRHPLPQDAAIQHAAYAFDQAFSMAAVSFAGSPAPKNTTAANFCSDLTDSNAILTSLSQPSDGSAGLVSFDASFNIVPASWNDFTRSISFTFPGVPGAIGGNYREPFTDTVQLKIVRDYFVIDSANIISAAASGGGVVNAAAVLDSSGGAVKCVYSLAEIPFIAKTQIVSAPAGTPDTALRSQSIVQAGGIVIGGGSWYETLPTLEAYRNLIANAVSQQWNSVLWGGSNTVPTTGSGRQAQFVAEDSVIEQFAGNIVCRATGYILCK